MFHRRRAYELSMVIRKILPTRRSLMLLGLLVLPWTLVACPLSIEAEKTWVGEPCVKSADCVEGYCVTELPDGYCSASCDFASCPEGSTCVHFDIWIIKTSVCLRTCERHADCERPGYVCRAIPGGDTKVCDAEQHP